MNTWEAITRAQNARLLSIPDAVSITICILRRRGKNKRQEPRNKRQEARSEMKIALITKINFLEIAFLS
jgi:hypothetical protein